MTALSPTAYASMPELRRMTRELNLHVPPSYFAATTSRLPYEEAISSLLAADEAPLHLYVGVPLCEEQCRFCMYFYGFADEEGEKSEACLAGLEELCHAIAPAVGRRIAGMYVGGGTPTILAAGQIDRLLAAVNSTFTFEAGSQRTFEMSPRSFSRDKVRAMARGGVGRVSFGVQSFDVRPVRRAGRAYVGPQRVAEIIATCREEGIDEINADLMVGLADESAASLADSVEHLVGMGCPTVSIYRYRQARKAELDGRGGLDAYVRDCASSVARAVEVAAHHGYEVYGRVDGEHVRLSAPSPCPWPERNLYETRFRPHLGNSLVGLGSGARSFLRDERLVHCQHRSSAGFALVGRDVEVEDCDGPSRLAAALVNGLFRDFEVDLTPLRDVHREPDWSSVEPAISFLASAGILAATADALTVAPHHRAHWAYWDKLLYPADWLRRRQRSHRLRAR